METATSAAWSSSQHRTRIDLIEVECAHPVITPCSCRSGNTPGNCASYRADPGYARRTAFGRPDFHPEDRTRRKVSRCLFYVEWNESGASCSLHCGSMPHARQHVNTRLSMATPPDRAFRPHSRHPCLLAPCPRTPAVRPPARRATAARPPNPSGARAHTGDGTCIRTPH